MRAFWYFSLYTIVHPSFYKLWIQTFFKVRFYNLAFNNPTADENVATSGVSWSKATGSYCRTRLKDQDDSVKLIDKCLIFCNFF